MNMFVYRMKTTSQWIAEELKVPSANWGDLVENC